MTDLSIIFDFARDYPIETIITFILGIWCGWKARKYLYLADLENIKSQKERLKYYQESSKTKKIESKLCFYKKAEVPILYIDSKVNYIECQFRKDNNCSITNKLCIFN